MLFLPKSAAARARTQAENLLRLADKVDCYRRDAVPPAALDNMRAAAAHLRQLWDDKQASAEALNQGAEELHAAMLPCGGDIYPLTFSGEYTEMLIVTAIIVIGIRAFFLQPFKIPTNSMYPTYFGMTPHVYPVDGPGPGLAEQAWNFIVQGAIHHVVLAPADGEVTLPINPNTFMAVNSYVSARTWSRAWLVSQDMRQYEIASGDAVANVLLPWDFDMGFDEAFYATYFPDLYAKAWKDPYELKRLLQVGGFIKQDALGNPYVSTGRMVHKGDRILDFDLRTGDMLFVDRFSYNFISPKPGDPFVFHTGGIAGYKTQMPDGTSQQLDQYLIKRLAGAPGDVLDVRPPMLYRNNQPATGAAAFDLNAHQVGQYPGYFNGEPGRGEYLFPRTPFEVPNGYYFAMGDNSPISYDSRFWGPMPAQNVVGRAVFIIYPFSSRWGPAH